MLPSYAMLLRGRVEVLFWELSSLNLCLLAFKLIYSTFTASLSICCLKSVVIAVRACRGKTRVNCSSALLMLMSCRFLKYSLCVPHNSCLPVSIVILVLTASCLSLLLIAHYSKPGIKPNEVNKFTLV